MPETPSRPDVDYMSVAAGVLLPALIGKLVARGVLDGTDVADIVELALFRLDKGEANRPEFAATYDKTRQLLEALVAAFPAT
jgi:hypothetical protein